MGAFTSKDVARAAGVSQSTVSYVMSGKRPISASTRERVLAAIEQLTYEPNAGARALAGRRTNVVGLVVPFGDDADTVGLLPFIETIASSARAHDHEVLLVTNDEGSAGLRRLAGRSLCDAIVMMDIRAQDERIPVAAALPVPVVLVGVPEDPQGLSCVDLDFEQAARLAVDELADTGHDQIVVVGYPAPLVERRVNYVERFLGAAHAHAALRGVPVVVVQPEDAGRAAAAKTVDAVLRRASRRLGVVVPFTALLRPLLHAFAARGVVLGADVSLIGLSTDADAADAEPAYTNISLEPRDVSRRAMETLFRLLDPLPGVAHPAVDLVAPRLSRRGTVMPAPAIVDAAADRLAPRPAS